MASRTLPPIAALPSQDSAWGTILLPPGLALQLYALKLYAHVYDWASCCILKLHAHVFDLAMVPIHAGVVH